MTEKLKTFYNLPSKVKFCSLCVNSNQYPASIPEFKHSVNRENANYINFDSDDICDGCNQAKAKIETPDSTFVKEIPAQLTVNKGWGSVKVTVEDECYLRTTEEVGDSVEPAFWLNFFNIFVFWPVDVVTGAMWEYESSTVVTLQPKTTENCVE